jgi:FkbM family methyltransferase
MHRDTTDFIPRHVYFFGVWEPNLSAWLARRLKPGDTFVDVGANVGYFTSLAAHAVSPSRGQGIAVEPEPSIRSLLARNVALNAFSNVRVIPEAATDVERDLASEVGGEHDMGTTHTVSASSTAAQRGIIRGRPLDDLLTLAERSAASVIKIDIEGAELDAVHGLHLEHGGCRDDVEIVAEVAPERLAARGRTVESLFVRMRGSASTLIRSLTTIECAYVHGAPPEPPLGLRSALKEQTDVLFSREDRDSL